MPNILLGVTGGIAAYKAAETASLFTKSGHSVKTLMTESALKFIT
ncbi:MAG: bifunctional 4'-phosphopantothenoylcysteine decarboxylase/phosphopantothenoylcysteine synthetase, partial [Elusimicrobia bacterium]|nr:bifunctional 4'-phosphopantothenoylcysteine decarboxylase/phosphopantothenoylcysteine synthetase [Elusimicrobiota bacterium]